MRCKICGAKLRKEGDICKSCYEEYCKEESLDKDTNEIFKLYRQYLPKYQLTRFFDFYIVMLLLIMVAVAQKSIGLTLLFILVAVVGVIIALVISKKIAENTTCTFYEKKVVHRYKKKTKTIAYSDLKNVTYYQNFFQKIFKLGDIQFRPEVGTYLITGFEIKNVPDIENNWAKIQEILGAEKED